MVLFKGFRVLLSWVPLTCGCEWQTPVSHLMSKVSKCCISADYKARACLRGSSHEKNNNRHLSLSGAEQFSNLPVCVYLLKVEARKSKLWVRGKKGERERETVCGVIFIPSWHLISPAARFYLFIFRWSSFVWAQMFVIQSSNKFRKGCLDGKTVSTFFFNMTSNVANIIFITKNERKTEYY